MAKPANEPFDETWIEAEIRKELEALVLEDGDDDSDEECITDSAADITERWCDGSIPTKSHPEVSLGFYVIALLFCLCCYYGKL